MSARGENAPHSDRQGGEPLPELLQPQPLVAAPRAAGAALAVALGLGALFVAFGDRLAPKPAADAAAARDGGGKPVITLAADQAQGAFQILPTSIQKTPGSVLAQMNMPEAEKRRLAQELADERVRLAAVTLWDNVNEDGDAVEVSAAGFRQRLVIMHKPKTFFVPVQFGGSVAIKAVHDGGGGVTLGVSTILGPVPLPPLAVGQVVEIPIL